MLILLPPSETKSEGGGGAPLKIDQISWPELSATRTRVAKALVAVSAKPRAGLTAIGIGASQRDELQRNLSLWSSPTMPAVERYTGVLYDALNVGSLTAAQRRRADERILIGSALFGVVRSHDLIPAYRLSAASRLPRLGSLSALWRPKMQPLLAAAAETELVIDLRSGSYQALAPIPGAVTVQVLNEAEDGTRTVVSHFNKATKGAIARVLATTPRPATRVADVSDTLSAAGWRIESGEENQLVVVL